MYSFTQTRGQARALVGAVLVAGGLGGALFGAYAVGANAETHATQARVKRLADAAAAGFSDAALKHSAQAMSPGALAEARRQDPTLKAAEAAGDRTAQERAAALLAARAVDHVPAQAHIAPTLVSGPAAQPFRLTGALDSSRDLDCLTQAVYYEAGSDTPAGQAAVAQVVLNRVRHPTFPKTVCGVVYQGAAAGRCQFSFVCDGAMRRTRSPAMWESSRRVAARALGGYVMPEAGEAVSFHAAYLGHLWSGMQPVGRIGAHIFYRMGHGGGGFGNGVYALERRPASDGAPQRQQLADAAPAVVPDSGVSLTSGAPSADQAGRPAVAITSTTSPKSADAPAKPASATVPASAAAS